MAIGQISFLAGIWGTLGVITIIALIVGIIALAEWFDKWKTKHENKPNMALGYEKEYLKRQYYEELFYINKYRDQLQKGEWPREMDEKFEFAIEKETSAGLDSEGFIYTYKKSFLRLKDKFRKSKDEKAKDDKNAQDKKDEEPNDDKK